MLRAKRSLALRTHFGLQVTLAQKKAENMKLEEKVKTNFGAISRELNNELF